MRPSSNPSTPPPISIFSPFDSILSLSLFSGLASRRALGLRAFPGLFATRPTQQKLTVAPHPGPCTLFVWSCPSIIVQRCCVSSWPCTTRPHHLLYGLCAQPVPAPLAPPAPEEVDSLVGLLDATSLHEHVQLRHDHAASSIARAALPWPDALHNSSLHRLP